jgi:hypothetical protein
MRHQESADDEENVDSQKSTPNDATQMKHHDGRDGEAA